MRMAEETWIEQIGNELERIFRYLLPGVAVMGFARLSHPSWFCPVHLDNSQHLAILAGIALCVGCGWYVVHRYSLHQFADWIFYCCGQGRFRGFPAWLAQHVTESGRSKANDAGVRHNIGIRSAHIIFMYIIAEAGLLFLIAPEKGSIFLQYQWWIRWACVTIFLAAFLQQWLTSKIDLYAVKTRDTVSLKK
jgi:hypothetical protein